MSVGLPASVKGRSVGSVNYGFGGKKSTARLRELDFDPIKALVDTYKKVEKEINRQEKIQEGSLVELNAQGLPRAYRPDVHHALFDKQIAVGEKLMRYMYGRVPDEGQAAPMAPPSLVVQLTQKGETYVINEQPPEDEEEDFDDAPSS